jgi:RecG-like helicase
MSATPIPRTLAMIEMGIFSLSAIEKAPAGRLPVRTHVVMDDARSQVPLASPTLPAQSERRPAPVADVFR